jgi:hypothetical protein
VPRFAAPWSETLPDERRRRNRSLPPRSCGRPHLVACDKGMLSVANIIDMNFLSFDKDFADSARQQGCSCGGRLHNANYPRAPRGGPDHLPLEYRCRFSFCFRSAASINSGGDLMLLRDVNRA